MTAKRNSSISSHVAALIAARVVAGAISAVTAILLPRALGVEVYGQYGIAIGLAGMLVVLSDLGITTSFARYLAEGTIDRSTMTKVGAWRVGSALLAALGLLGFGLIVQLGWLDSGSGKHDMVPAFLYLSAALILSNSLFGVANGLLPTMRKLRMQFIIMVAQPVIELVGMIAALQFAFGARGVIVASTVAGLTMGIVGVAAVYMSLPKSGGATSARSVGAYSLPMFVVFVCFSVFGQIDQLVIWAFHGSTVVAGYILCWKLITLMHLPGLAVGTVVAPRLVGAGDAGRATYMRWLGMLAILYGGMTAIAVSLSPVLIPYALGNAWADSTPIFVSLALYSFLLGLAPHVTITANFLGGAGRRVRLSIVTLVLNLALDLALVPSMGVYGAAIGTSVAFGWYVGAHALLSMRLLEERNPGSAKPMTALRAIRMIAVASWFIGAVALTSQAVRYVTLRLDGRIPTLVEIFIAAFAGIAVYSFATVLFLRYGKRSGGDAPPGESASDYSTIEDEAIAEEGAA